MFGLISVLCQRDNLLDPILLRVCRPKGSQISFV
jgi:hypothetical protein